jgi:hypothetical protein
MTSFTSNGINYTILDEINLFVTVGDNSTYAGIPAVVIPDTVDEFVTYTVTSVSNNAFQANTTITSVDLTDCTALTTIGQNAFAGLTTVINLANVYLPNSLLSIYPGAFALTSITSITIPASVTSIGIYAFSSNSSLSNVIFEGNLFI